MSHLYKTLLVLMLIGGCGGIADGDVREDVPEEDIFDVHDQETNQPYSTTVALAGGCNEVAAMIACGTATFFCLRDCGLAAGAVAAGADPTAAALLCISTCAPLGSLCIAAVQACWNQWTNPQSGDTEDTSPGVASGCEDFYTTLCRGYAVEDDPPCEPRWNCDDWSDCLCIGGTASIHSRTCTDLNGCEGTPAVGATAIIQTEGCNPCGNGQCDSDCEHCATCPQDCGACPPPSPASCATDWTCTSWSSCPCSGVRTRTCTDEESCGTTADRPPLTSTCVVCGDGACNCGESSATCPEDCGSPIPCACSPWETSSCITYCGSTTGIRTCQEDCSWGYTCATTGEVCNGQDDDCDGAPDDGLTCGGGSDTCIGVWPWTNCACIPPSNRCVGNERQRCDNGNWVNASTCDDPEWCNGFCNAGTGLCECSF